MFFFLISKETEKAHEKLHITYRSSPHLNKVEGAEGRKDLREREGDNTEIRKPTSYPLVNVNLNKFLKTSILD